jgi:hypothetical protein
LGLFISYGMGTGILSLEVKQPECETDHFPSCADVKDLCSCWAILHPLPCSSAWRAGYLIPRNKFTWNLFTLLSSMFMLLRNISQLEFYYYFWPTIYNTNSSAQQLFENKVLLKISTSHSCSTIRHEGAWVKRRYSSYSFSTSALDGRGWSASRPSRDLALGKGPPVPIVQEAGWAPEPVWTQRL